MKQDMRTGTDDIRPHSSSAPLTNSFVEPQMEDTGLDDFPDIDIQKPLINIRECLKKNIYNYFREILGKSGPMHVDDPVLLEKINSFPDEAKMIADTGGIGKFLQQNFEFAFVKDTYICLVEQLPVAYRKINEASLPIYDLDLRISDDSESFDASDKNSSEIFRLSSDLNPDAREYKPGTSASEPSWHHSEDNIAEMDKEGHNSPELRLSATKPRQPLGINLENDFKNNLNANVESSQQINAERVNCSCRSSLSSSNSYSQTIMDADYHLGNKVTELVNTFKKLIRMYYSEEMEEHRPYIDAALKPFTIRCVPKKYTRSIQTEEENYGGNFKSKAPSDSTDAVKDKRSEEYQRIIWKALKKSIIGITNKVNGSNILEIIPELYEENIIRGRGVLARAIMKAQAASPTFTPVYAVLVAIINTEFPEIGDLILKRLIIQYKEGFQRNDKTIIMTAARFLAHLLNQEVVYEVLILEICTHLLENPTDDSVEIAIATLKECGKKMTQLTPEGMRAITERLRNVLHEASIDMRVCCMIKEFFTVQKDGFKDFEVIPSELDLVEEDAKYAHLINLDDAVDAQDMLNVFRFDPDYLENEEKYKSIANEILRHWDTDDSDTDDSDIDDSGNESGEDEENEENADGSALKILVMTETILVSLEREICVIIQSSLEFENNAHKLLGLGLKPEQIVRIRERLKDLKQEQKCKLKILFH